MLRVLFLTDEIVSNDESGLENLDFTKAIDGFYLHVVRDFILREDVPPIPYDAFAVMDMSGKVYTVPPMFVRFNIKFWEDLQERMVAKGLTAADAESIVNEYMKNGL